MNRLFHIAIFFITLCINIDAFSQKTLSDKANEDFDNQNYSLALSVFIELYRNDTTNLSIVKKIADSYFFISDYDKSVYYYKKLADANISQPVDLLRFAQVLKIKGQYSEASVWLKKYLLLVPDDKLAQLELKNLDNPEKTGASTLYSIRNLDLNTRFIDMSPAFFKGKLVFASTGNLLNKKSKMLSTMNNQPFLDLYTADDNGDPNSVALLAGKINTKYHEGPVCFSKDGNTMYFTRNNFLGVTFRQQETKVNNLKIFIAHWNGQEWADITEFPYNSDKYSLGHAALSPDEQTLFFSSNMPGGFGDSDLYKCRIVNGQWTTPENLGPTINSKGKEMFPYQDDRGNLYFSSNGHGGLGGLDIWMAIDNQDGTYRLENPGKPLNSSYDDFGLVKRNADCSGYFTSNRAGGKGYDDIYSYKIEAAELAVQCFDAESKTMLPSATVILKNEEGQLISSSISDESGIAHFVVEPCRNYHASAQKQYYSESSGSVSFDSQNPGETLRMAFSLRKLVPELKIRIVDSESNDRIRNAKLDFFDGTINRTVAANEGEYVIDLPQELTLDLFVRADGYLGKNISYVFEGEGQRKSELTVALERVEAGKTIVLKNIYYDLNRWEIRPDAALELDNLVRFLHENQRVKIELGSHTDSRASDQYNQRLSQLRAEAAVNYLIQQGVDRSRLIAKGYGETQLLNQCADGVRCSEQEHQANRRTELRILEN